MERGEVGEPIASATESHVPSAQKPVEDLKRVRLAKRIRITGLGVEVNSNDLEARALIAASGSAGAAKQVEEKRAIVAHARTCKRPRKRESPRGLRGPRGLCGFLLLLSSSEDLEGWFAKIPSRTL